MGSIGASTTTIPEPAAPTMLPEIANINTPQPWVFNDLSKQRISDTIEKLASGKKAKLEYVRYFHSDSRTPFGQLTDMRDSVVNGIKAALKANKVSNVRVTTSAESIGSFGTYYYVTIRPTSKFKGEW